MYGEIFELLISYIIIAAVAGVFISRAMIKKQKKKHDNVQLKSEAGQYVRKNTLNITNGNERFLYHPVAAVPVGGRNGGGHGGGRGPGGPGGGFGGGFGGGPGGFGGGPGGPGGR